MTCSLNFFGNCTIVLWRVKWCSMDSAGYRLLWMLTQMMPVWDVPRSCHVFGKFYFGLSACVGAYDFEFYADVFDLFRHGDKFSWRAEVEV